jgi:hypothetical protein
MEGDIAGIGSFFVTYFHVSPVFIAADFWLICSDFTFHFRNVRQTSPNPNRIPYKEFNNSQTARRCSVYCLLFFDMCLGRFDAFCEIFYPDFPHEQSLTLLEFLFETEFAEWHENSCARIRETTGLTKSMIYRWRKQWILDKKWRPWDLSVHGRHHRIFNQDEETGIKECIIANYLIPGIIFSDQMFRENAIKAFLVKYEREENVPEFNCSDS